MKKLSSNTACCSVLHASRVKPTRLCSCAAVSTTTRDPGPSAGWTLPHGDTAAACPSLQQALAAEGQTRNDISPT